MTMTSARKVRLPTAVDLFAGGGGASEGILQALGVGPAVAINHDVAAIAMHQANHPTTIHMCEDLYRVTPFRPNKRHIDLLWASPDCTHHSRAKGGKPVVNKRRMLAWVVLEWARAVTPTVIVLENVPEFKDWGPLGPDNKPIREKRGETFREFVQGLTLAGYRVEHRVLIASHFGAPTSRRRLFMIARSDGKPIVWPTPTHGAGLLPVRTAAECIDWSIPIPSIFDRKRPLALATQRRIAEGIRRYVLAGDPFIVSLDHQSAGASAVRGLNEPLSTATTKARHAVAAPVLVQVNHGRDVNRSQSLEQPMPTVATGTGAHGFAVVAPTLIQMGYGERDGQAPRVLDLNAPLGTVVAGGPKHALVAAFIAKHNGGKIGAIGRPLTDPLHTITVVDSKALAAVSLTKFYGSCAAGQELGQPMPTVTTGGGKGGGHIGLVAAFMTKFYGQGGQHQGLDEPLHTVRTHDCFAVVTVDIDGETYAIVDIGMRMLSPRELATAQGFGPDYILTGSKRDQVARIGNSVCPPVAKAVVESQFGGARISVEQVAA